MLGTKHFKVAFLPGYYLQKRRLKDTNYNYIYIYIYIYVCVCVCVCVCVILILKENKVMIIENNMLRKGVGTKT